MRELCLGSACGLSKRLNPCAGGGGYGGGDGYMNEGRMQGAAYSASRTELPCSPCTISPAILDDSGSITCWCVRCCTLLACHMQVAGMEKAVMACLSGR